MKLCFASQTKMNKIFVGEIDTSIHAQIQEFQANLRVENAVKQVLVKSFHRRYADLGRKEHKIGSLEREINFNEMERSTWTTA